jgi:hypothetical protein
VTSSTHVSGNHLRGVSAARNHGIARDRPASSSPLPTMMYRSIPGGSANSAPGSSCRRTSTPVSGLVLPLELRTEPQLWFEEYFGGFNQTLDGELLSIELLADDPLFPYSTGRFGASCNMAIRSSVLKELGDFDVRLGVGTPTHGGEDIDMSMKIVLANGTFAFEPRALVRHQHRDTAEGFFTQVFGYGTGLTAMFTKLIVNDPRHLFKMARRFSRGLRVLFKPRDKRSPSAFATYPRKTYAYHFLGMAYGPLAYARSAARYRGQR